MTSLDIQNCAQSHFQSYLLEPTIQYQEIEKISLILRRWYQTADVLYKNTKGTDLSEKCNVTCTLTRIVIEKILSKKLDFFLICKNESELLGVMTLERHSYSRRQGGFLYISYLLVNPDYIFDPSKPENKISGIGRHLLRSAESICWQLDLDYISLNSTPNARTFYLHYGYEIPNRNNFEPESWMYPDLYKPATKLIESELVPVKTGYVYLESDDEKTS